MWDQAAGIIGKSVSPCDLYNGLVVTCIVVRKLLVQVIPVGDTDLYSCLVTFCCVIVTCLVVWK